jgi:hypothetical protein
MIPQNIANNKLLITFATVRPTTIPTMAACDGCNIQRAGLCEDMLTLIRNYSIENDLQTDVLDQCATQATQAKKTANTFPVSIFIFHYKL